MKKIMLVAFLLSTLFGLTGCLVRGHIPLPGAVVTVDVPRVVIGPRPPVCQVPRCHRECGPWRCWDSCEPVPVPCR
jgi:hypothetical protein